MYKYIRYYNTYCIIRYETRGIIILVLKVDIGIIWYTIKHYLEKVAFTICVL